MRPRQLLPGATIGVMGGGQLGRMFALVARRMGYHVHTFTPENDSPAGQLADIATVADYLDEDAVSRFARSVDVLTFEFENIPPKTIAWCARHCEARPDGAILQTTQHRLREKEWLAGAGLPLAPFRRVASADDLAQALAEIGAPAVLKTAAFGYDGKGQRFVRPGEDAAEVWADRGAEECVLEKAVPFEKEISVIVARGIDGELRTFPASENIHRHHILDLTIAPARIDRPVEQAAAELARAVAQKLELVGLLAVEMFLEANGTLLINELAPRPHNSGHWTIEACATSQFEQQLRAVCGLPLGATTVLRPAAMANLLGDTWSGGEPDWPAALAFPELRLHLYGKREPRPARKMGHLTATAASVEEAMETVRAARSAWQR